MNVPRQWRKSSFTGGENCVEVAYEVGHPRGYVRDSKNKNGPELAVDVRLLINAIKAGKLQ